MVNITKSRLAGERRYFKELKRRDKKHSYSTVKSFHNRHGQETLLIAIPTNFSIYDVDYYFSQSLKLIDTLDKTSDKNQITKIILDFSNADSLKAAAVVLLYATIEVLITQHGKQIRLINYTHSKGLKTVIRESGIDKLCRGFIPSNYFSESYMPVISGVGGCFREEIVDFIMQKIYANNMDALLENKYSSAVQEAILNVNAHAYTDNEDKQWWVICSYLKNSNQLYLVIYDRGMGIPASTRNGHECVDELDFSLDETKHFFEIMKTEVGDKITIEQAQDLLKQSSINEYLSDAGIIYASMIAGATRRLEKSEEIKHGQGSVSIKNLVKSNEHGILWIYSNFGLVKYKRGCSKNYETIDLPKRIRGTLIQWNIEVTV